LKLAGFDGGIHAGAILFERDVRIADVKERGVFQLL